MKKGDLRRFNGNLIVDDAEFGVGDIFVVLDVRQPGADLPKQVTFLVRGTIMTGWSYPWVMNTSEALNAAG